MGVFFSSVTQSCQTLCIPMDCSTPGFPVHYQLLELTQTNVQVSDAIQQSHPLVLSHPSCWPLLLLPSVFPSIMVFSSQLALRIRWPKYWSFNFSLSPSNEYSGLISFSEVKYRLKFGVSVVKANVGRSHKLQRRASVKIQR